ncbi:hypothetical protein BGZ65_012671, partial [Modicella reniformis]
MNLPKQPSASPSKAQQQQAQLAEDNELMLVSSLFKRTFMMKSATAVSTNRSTTSGNITTPSLPPVPVPPPAPVPALESNSASRYSSQHQHHQLQGAQPQPQQRGSRLPNAVFSFGRMTDQVPELSLVPVPEPNSSAGICSKTSRPLGIRTSMDDFSVPSGFLQHVSSAFPSPPFSSYSRSASPFPCGLLGNNIRPGSRWDRHLQQSNQHHLFYEDQHALASSSSSVMSDDMGKCSPNALPVSSPSPCFSLSSSSSFGKGADGNLRLSDLEATATTVAA